MSAAIRAAGGKPSSARSASSRAANPAGSQRTSAWTAGDAGVGADDDRAARPAPARRRWPSGAAPPRRRAGRAARAAPSRRAAAPRRSRPGTAARRPGVATTTAGSAATSASTWSPPEVRTGTPGNARPSSSAVRPDPTTTARSAPAAARRAGPVARPAARTTGRPATARSDGAASGPEQTAHRAGVRSRAQASDRHVPAARHLHEHRLARRPGRRGSCARPGSAAGRRPRPGRGRSRRRRPTGRTRGAAARSTARSATISCAQPDSTSCCASAVRAYAADQQRRAGLRPSAAPARRGCAGTGARGSACRSSPSSQIASRPEVGDRRVGGGPGADRDPHRRRGARPASAGSARPARDRRTGRRAGPRPRAAVKAASRRVEVAGVGDDDDRAAAGVERACARRRRAGPASPPPAAPTTPPGPGGPPPTAARNAGAGAVAVEPVGSGGWRQVARRLRAAPASAAACRAGTPEPHDVDEVAGPAVGDGAEQRRGLGGQHRLARPPRARRTPAGPRARCRRPARGRRRRPAGRRSAPAPASRPGPRRRASSGTR